MAGPDVLPDFTDAPPKQPKTRPGLPDWLKRVSDRTPLRAKLITSVLVLVIMALAAISVASVYMLRSYVTTQHDGDLQSAISFVNTTGHLQQRISVGIGNAGPTQSNVVEGLQQPGQQLSWQEFANLPGTGNPDPLPQLPTNGLWTGKAGNVTVASLPAQSGTHTWRVMAETVNVTNSETGQQTTTVLVVAEDIGDISALTARLVLFDLIVGGAIVVVLAVVAIGVIRTNLRPLNDIELTAGQIAAGHLYHRVPEGDSRTEVGSLGRSLNAMLTQIENAFRSQQQSEQDAHQSEERMRRFIADASHELRTPLTTIRGFAAHYRQRGGAGATEATLTSPSSGTEPAASFGAGYSSSGADGLSPDDLDHLMGRIESEATRMGLLVEDLLTLARLDQQRPLVKAPVDLLMLAADAVQDARIVAPGRPVDLVVAPGTAFLVEGDESRLRQVVGNLVNNALTHTPPGTPVRVKISRGALATEAPAVVLDVEDDGPGMTTDQAQRVFERFYRADAARNRASGGTGLGLAIVAGLVSAHGGTVSVRTAPGQGADFQVKLPLSPDVLAAADDGDEAYDDLPG